VDGEQPAGTGRSDGPSQHFKRAVPRTGPIACSPELRCVLSQVHRVRNRIANPLHRVRLKYICIAPSRPRQRSPAQSFEQKSRAAVCPGFCLQISPPPHSIISPTHILLTWITAAVTSKEEPASQSSQSRHASANFPRTYTRSQARKME